MKASSLTSSLLSLTFPSSSSSSLLRTLSSSSPSTSSPLSLLLLSRFSSSTSFYSSSSSSPSNFLKNISSSSSPITSSSSFSLFSSSSSSSFVSPSCSTTNTLNNSSFSNPSLSCRLNHHQAFGTHLPYSSLPPVYFNGHLPHFSMTGGASHSPIRDMHATTILTVRKNKKVVVIGDGQVTLGGSIIVKSSAKKVRRIKDDIIAGFAGSTADALTLIEKLETKLEEHPGQLLRSCVELAKMWRTNKYLRPLEALLCVSDREISLTLTGHGDVLEPEDGLIGIGSGGTYALCCAKGLLDTDLDAEAIARKSMKVAADICCFTNHNWIIETLDSNK